MFFSGLLIFQIISFWFIFLRETIKKTVGIKVRKLPSAFYRLYQLILINYETIYFLVFLISVNFFTCRDIKVELVNDTGPGLTFFDSEENAVSDVANSYFVTATKNYQNFKIVSVMNLSDSVTCLSGNHLITITISVFVLLMNIVYKYISNRVLKFLPRKNILNSKYGQTDILYDICLNLIVISNVVSKKYLTDIFFL